MHVMRVDGRRIASLLAALVALPAAAVASTPVPDGPCRAGERIVLTCALAKGRRIGLCASADLSATGGYLQYRATRDGTVELGYPAEREGSRLAFRLAHYFRYQVDRWSVRFSNKGFTYVVFANSEADATPAVREWGVQVTAPGASTPSATLRCREPVIADFSLLEGLVPCDTDDPSNMARCP